MSVGTIVNSSVPLSNSNYLLCNGSSYNTTTYPALFAVLGSSNLPNYDK